MGRLRWRAGTWRARLRPRALLSMARASADVRSFIRWRRLETVHLVGRQPPSSVAVAVRVRALGGAAVGLRRGTSDALVARDTFMGAAHLPPAELREVSSVLDLGANIGLTVAHLAHLHPVARVLGVEMDPESARLASRNVARWADRAEVRHAAVWTREGQVGFRGRGGGEYARRVEAFALPDDLWLGSAPAFTLDQLVDAAAGADGWVDYVKMDVEGAEAALLAAPGAWARRVRAIKVEVHPPYTLRRCLDDLLALGFCVRPDARSAACAVGIGESRR